MEKPSRKSDKGKPVERLGRNTTGLRRVNAKIARLPELIKEYRAGSNYRVQLCAFFCASPNIQFHFEEYLSLLRLIGRDGNDGNDEALSRITFTLAEAVPTSVLEPTMFLLPGTGLLGLVD